MCEAKVYTVSYTGWTPDQLLQKAEALGATILDVRYRPYSRRSQWGKSALQAIMGLVPLE